MIASPLHLFECSLDNDGGYAIVVASEEIARDCKTKPVWVIGGAEAMYTDGYQTITAPWNDPKGAAVKRATEIAFGKAGITHDDIDDVLVPVYSAQEQIGAVVFTVLDAKPTLAMNYKNLFRH